MFHLKFNPYYALTACTLTADGPTFPFKDGDIVVIHLSFGPRIPVTQDRSLEEDLIGTKAITEIPLIPKGSLDNEQRYVLSQVWIKSEFAIKHTLRFGYDTEDILQVLITDTDAETQFPVDKIRTIRMSLMVERVQKMPAIRPISDFDPLWCALLSPFGEEVDGLILSEVELVE